MLSFSIPTGFQDRTQYQFRSKKRKRDYKVTHVEGSAVVTFQERRLWRTMSEAADQFEQSGHATKLSGNKGILVLRVKPVKGRGKKGEKGELVIRAAVKCVGPDLAVRLIALNRKDDAKEFAAALASMRRVSGVEATRIRIEQPGDRSGKWRPAGPVELKLPSDFEMHVPLPQVDQNGKLIEFFRTAPRRAEEVATADWPLCDKVLYLEDDEEYIEIDEGDPGLAEPSTLSAPDRTGPGDLRLYYSSFNKEKTTGLLEQMNKSYREVRK